ncbi:hypothetical protein [Olivibacter jilunii]|uniref:hypothetical protein n=1 Tax=Olivibacter jilunii TaxID=985016 RepID=UPI003F15F0CB
MTGVKDELQDIIIGNGSIGSTSKLKKAQNFLSRYAQTSSRAEKQKYIKSEEEKLLIDFARRANRRYFNVFKNKHIMNRAYLDWQHSLRNEDDECLISCVVGVRWIKARV